jgi:NitT/TauT family transport system permease protein
MGQALMGMAQPRRREAGDRAVQPSQLAPAHRRRKARIFEFKHAVPWTWTLGLGIAVWVLFFGLWELAAARGWVNTLFMPPPHQVLAALHRMLSQGFGHDILVSVYRIVVSFLAASAIAVPIGILMGCFRAVYAFLNPFVAAWRYLPAPSFVPLLLMWFGAGEGSKLALLFIGVVFFLATLVMDHTRAVRSELVETAMTLGANRRQILTSVIVRAVLPNILVSMRQMLAVSWTYLVIAEIIASTTGIGAVMMRGQRFLHVDEIMAGIVVIGILGLLFDFLFRAAHRLLFPYIKTDAH